MSAFEDFKGKSAEELKGMVASLKREQLNLRFQRAGGELENTSRIRVVRRDIARAMTAIAQLGKKQPKKKKAA